MDTEQVHTEESKASAARDWHKSEMTQAQYAASLGISDRTLRNWISRWAPTYRESPAREVIEDAIERLRDVLVGLDAARVDGGGPAEETVSRAPTPGTPPSLSSAPRRLDDSKPIQFSGEYRLPWRQRLRALFKGKVLMHHSRYDLRTGQSLPVKGSHG